MQGINQAIAAVTLLSVCACGAIGNRNAPENASASPPSSEGTVVLSTGAASRCFQASTFLTIAPAGNAYLENVVRNVAVDVWSQKSDFSDHQGNISVVTLPAGTYEAYPWLAGVYVPEKIPYARFTVVAGKATYIGEFYLSVSCGTSTVGSFADQEDRDLQFVRQKNPGFANTVFEKQLAKFVGYIIDKR